MVQSFTVAAEAVADAVTTDVQAFREFVVANELFETADAVIEA